MVLLSHLEEKDVTALHQRVHAHCRPPIIQHDGCTDDRKIQKRYQKDTISSHLEEEDVGALHQRVHEHCRPPLTQDNDSNDHKKILDRY
jgi:hypothetical protein